MKNMKEELYNELHIKKEEDKEIINGLISYYRTYRIHDCNKIKALVKERYKGFKLIDAVELFNMNKNTIFINGILIFNSCDPSHKRELYYIEEDGLIDYWVDDGLALSIKVELIRTIETQHETLYREDETLLW